MLGPLDEGLFHLINTGWSLPVLDFIFVFFTSATKLWPVRVALGALFVAYVLNKTGRPAALLALVAWPLAEVLSRIVKTTFPTARPCAELANWTAVVDPFTTVRVIYLTSSGTMSAHAASMAAVATVFVLQLGKRGIPWAVVAFLTGVSRIYVGAHYPSQVVLGWLGGVFCGWVTFKTWAAYKSVRAPRSAQQRVLESNSNHTLD